jgi:hypothetical protein
MFSFGNLADLRIEADFLVSPSIQLIMEVTNFLPDNCRKVW